MVSKASDDFPDPDTPVMTTNLLRGTTTSMFLRLCSRAPRMTMDSMCGTMLTRAIAVVIPSVARDLVGCVARLPFLPVVEWAAGGRHERVVGAEVLGEIGDHRRLVLLVDGGAPADHLLDRGGPLPFVEALLRDEVDG